LFLTYSLQTAAQTIPVMSVLCPSILLTSSGQKLLSHCCSVSSVPNWAISCWARARTETNVWAWTRFVSFPRSKQRGQYTANCQPCSEQRGQYTANCQPCSEQRGQYTTNCQPCSEQRGQYTANCQSCSEQRSQYTTNCQPCSEQRGQYTANCQPCCRKRLNRNHLRCISCCEELPLGLNAICFVKPIPIRRSISTK